MPARQPPQPTDQTLIRDLRQRAMQGDSADELARVYQLDVAVVRRAIRGVAKTRPLSDEDIERFWSKVEISEHPDACWPWTGGTTKGRGQFAANGTTYQAHRLAYILERGPLPAHWIVSQTCNNLLCVRPTHLVASPPQASTKGVRGEDHPLASLTERQVAAIRVIRAAGIPYQVIADAVLLSESTIRRAVAGDRYEDAPGPRSGPVRDEPPAQPWERAFLTALRTGASISSAGAAAGVRESTVWHWRRRRSAFARAWGFIQGAPILCIERMCNTAGAHSWESHKHRLLLWKGMPEQ